MRRILLATIACCTFLVHSCIKDTCSSTYSYTYFVPVYKTSTEVRSNIKSNQPKEIERPGKLYIRGSFIFLNELDKGIHIIDNSNPSNPRNVAFIDIPGNMDMAVKGNTLYADLYTDLVSIDITNPLNTSVTKIVEGVFPRRFYNGHFMQDSSRVIVEWIEKDTTVTEDCNGGSWWEKDRGIVLNYAANSGGAGPAAVSPYGMGGSMARFALASERLYAVGDSDLDVFNISNPHNPSFVTNRAIGWGIETIYPFKDKLFIGSTTGMFIYSITNPDNPTQLGQFSHARSCDPVVADDTYAYVTLRSGTTCAGFSNQLDVIRLNNITNPSLVKTYPLTNPHGLSKDGNTLFICDGKAGLKIYNAADVNNLQLIKTISGIETFDVIAWNNVAIVVATDGLYQYDYSDLNNITLLSKITVTK